MDRLIKVLMFALIGVVLGPSLFGGTCFADLADSDLSDTHTGETFINCEAEDTLSSSVSVFHYHIELLGKAISSASSLPILPDIGTSIFEFSILKPTGPSLALEPEPPKMARHI